MNVNTIANLRATAGSSVNNFCTVFGYHQAGDEGGGDFFWDATSTQADNEGTIIKVTSLATGRWKRIVNTVASVKWFGARGDGTTDDSTPFEKFIAVYENMYIPKGDYVITRTINITGKSFKIESSPQAYLNKRFTAGDSMILFTNCPSLELNINVRKSIPSTILLNDNGTHDGIPQMRVEGLSGDIFRFSNNGKINIYNCDISEVYGYCVFRILNGFVVFNGCKIKGPAYTDFAIAAWGNETLEINNCLFEDIALLPDNFTVRKTGIDYPQTAGTTVYAWQFGQALSIMGNSGHIYACTFRNTSGLSIGSDNTTPTAPGQYPTYLVIDNNNFISDNLKLRGANPPGFIWAENKQSLVVKNNRFTYIKRASGDGDFKLCRFALARKHMESPFFEYSGNYFIRADSSTRDVGTIFILNGNDESVVNIKDNIHKCINSDFFFISTMSTVRPCRVLNIQGNDVICKNFVIGYNAEPFTGSNFFLLPKEINLIDNANVSAEERVFYLYGQYGGKDLTLNITGNIITKATNIGFLDGTFKANIWDNIAPNTEIFLDYFSTPAGRSNITIKRNQLAAIRLVSSNDCYYDISENIISGNSIFRYFKGARITGNKFGQLLLQYGCEDTVLMDNEFAGTLQFVDLNACVFQRNTFRRPSNGMEAVGTSGTVTNSSFIDNTWLTGTNGTFIRFATSTTFVGASFLTRNRLLRVSSSTLTLVASNKVTSGSVFKNYDNFLIV